MSGHSLRDWLRAGHIAGTDNRGRLLVGCSLLFGLDQQCILGFEVIPVPREGEKGRTEKVTWPPKAESQVPQLLTPQEVLLDPQKLTYSASVEALRPLTT